MSGEPPRIIGFKEHAAEAYLRVLGWMMKTVKREGEVLMDETECDPDEHFASRNIYVNVNNGVVTSQRKC